MALNMDQIRQRLASAEGKYRRGVATGPGGVGPNNILVDTGLSDLTHNDQLVGALLYMQETVDGLAPWPEYRRVSAYNAATQTITVAPAFSNPVEAGDCYDLFFSPLEMTDWNGIINRAIASAWPELYARAWTDPAIVAGQREYATHAWAHALDQVTLRPGGTFDGWPEEPLVYDQDYRVVGVPGVDLRVELLRRVEDTTFRLVFYFRRRYPELAPWLPFGLVDTTDLDPDYLIAAARAEYHAAMAGTTRGQAEYADHERMMAYWRGEAQRVKQALAMQLLANMPVGGGKEK